MNYFEEEESNVFMSTYYHRDPTVPFWSNVDVDTLFENHSHRPERAKAWLRFRDVSESCTAYGQAVMMRGHFEGGILGNHTYHWTFTPTYTGKLAIVLPVYDDCRLVDFLNDFVSEASVDPDEIKRLSYLFKESIKICNEAKGKAAFRPIRALNAAVFEAVVVGIAERISGSRKAVDISAVDVCYDHLLQDGTFMRACERATATDESVKTRQRLAIAAFKNV